MVEWERCFAAGGAMSVLRHLAQLWKFLDSCSAVPKVTWAASPSEQAVRFLGQDLS